MTLARTVLARLGGAVATALLLSVLVFALVDLAPGDPLVASRTAEGGLALDEATLALQRERLGLDRPFVERYARWAAGALQGDLGLSLRSGRPVLDEIGAAVGPTVELNAAAFALVLALGLPLGWASARRGGSRFDRATQLALVALFAVPTFWLALVLQNALAVRWPVFPLYGRGPVDGAAAPWARAPYLVLPALSLALHNLAFYARFARNTALSGWRSAHALAARANGVPDGRVFRRHAIRPSLVPLAALLGVVLPSFVSGSLYVENAFAWPGLGFLFLAAVHGRDVPVLLGLTLLAGLLTIAGSLVADLLTAWADPRGERRP